MVLCRAKLNVLMRDMRIEAMQVEHMAKAMESIAGRYQATENGLLDPELKRKSIMSNLSRTDASAATWASDQPSDTGAEKKETGDPIWKKILDNLIKVVTPIFGPIGTLASLYYALINKKYKDVGKYYVSFIGKEAAAAIKQGATWKDCFIGDLVASKSAGDIWQSTIDKYNPHVITKDGFDASKSVAGIFSIIATTVGCGIDNLIEQGGKVNARWAEETVTETLLSMGKTVLAGAIGTVIAGAFSISAPAWAAAAGVALIGVGLDHVGNRIVRKITRNENAKWLEYVSDGICDNIIEPVGKAVKGAVDSAKQGARWIGDKVGNTVRNLFGSKCAWAGSW